MSAAAPPAPGSYEDRVLGCMLGAVCGDVLGAPVEGWSAERIAAAYPDGVTAFVPSSERGHGRYTDDSQMLLALAASLVNRGRCNARDAARQYALAFDPGRGYGGSAVKILQQLVRGADPATTATAFLPQGSFGNGGAMRIAPLGLAYRHAQPRVLAEAVCGACLCTHTHPLGVEGALAQAAAVAQAAAGGSDARPQAFLAALAARLQAAQHAGVAVAEMPAKLAQLQEGLAEVRAKPAGTPWREWLASPGWQQELAVSAAVAPGFQIKATDAVAAALWAVVCHWDAPADALTAAVHAGGDTDTLACMAGALVGARHGQVWLPAGWLAALENAAAPSQDPEANPLATATAFFDAAALQQALASTRQQQQPPSAAAPAPVATPALAGSSGSGSGAGSSEGGAIVLTTRDLGRDEMVQLARLLARLDCRS